MKTKIEISIEELLKLAKVKLPKKHQYEVSIYQRDVHAEPNNNLIRYETGVTITIEPEEE